MLRMQKCLLAWTCVLLRLVYLSLRCDARAVNVSNTWTMPQEDLNVFYRFFRDRISWFEADAVCQFHHANLVTVDNSFQFDATRDLLRELDVNDIVWIGLLRPQNSDRFMWSNSRPLVTNTGYWAEALPLMDAPLCAVIDPIRDYRWHALRCGGPETASFLCEMPVPAWADVCLIKDMPNLTMQYMADTASIELIRNCQEEGLLRQTCKSKEDRERAMVELICPKERLESQRVTDITNSHFKSLHIINSISTDNNEKNDIEVMPVLPHYGVVDGVVVDNNNHDRLTINGQQQENTVQHLIEQFSVDDMMQGDEPIPGSGYEDEPQPKPEKNMKKLLNAKDRKELCRLEREQRRQDEQQRHTKMAKDDMIMMMGDQPMTEDALQLEHVPNEQQPEGKGNDDEASVNNEIFELLPHRKRILMQDLKPLTSRRIDDTKNQMSTQSTSNSDSATATTTTTTKAISMIPSEAERTTTTPNLVKIAATTEDGLKPTTTRIQTTTTITQLTNEPAATLTRDMINAGAESDITSTSTSTPATTTTTTISTGIKNGKNALSHAHHESTSSVTVGHAIHPAQSRDDSKHGQQQHQQQQQQKQQGLHSKETTDTSHFIPPMLLVKSHYVPMAKHEKEHEHNIGPEFNDRNKQQHHHSGQLGQHRRNNQHREQHKGSAGDALLTTLTPITLRTNVADATTPAATTATTNTEQATNSAATMTQTMTTTTTLMPPRTTATTMIEVTKLTKAGAGADGDDFTPSFNAETEPTPNGGHLTTAGERLVTESVAPADRQAKVAAELEAAAATTTTTLPTTTTTTTNVKTFAEHKNAAAAVAAVGTTTTITDRNVAATTEKLPTTIASEMNEKQVEQIKMAAYEATNPETLVDMVPTAATTITTRKTTAAAAAATTTTTTPFGTIAAQKQAINELKTNGTATTTTTTTTTTRTTTTTEREIKAETETEAVSEGKATAETEPETSSIELKKFTLASNEREKGTEAKAKTEKERETIKKTKSTTTKTGTLAATSAIMATISTTKAAAFPTTALMATTTTSTPTPATTPTMPTTTVPTTTTTNRNFFLDAATEAQYKPNRRRSLTKPETQSYFKKILG